MNRRGQILCALAASIVLAKVGHAQVLDQVPEKAIFVVDVKNVQGFSQKIADFSKAIGVSADVPELADPIGALTDKMKIKAGFNKAGDAAIVAMDYQPNMDNQVMFLLPVSDYQAFVGNFTDGKTENGITTTTLPDDTKTTYIAQWGNYAVFSQSMDLISAKPTGMKLSDTVSKALDAKDVIEIVNIAAFRDKALDAIDKGQTQFQSMMDDQSQNNEKLAKMLPLAKVAMGQLFNIPKETLKDADTAAIGIGIDDKGVSTTVMADFKPDTYLGKMTSSMKGTDKPLLAGLPEASYLFYGGASLDPAVTKPLVSDLLDPIGKAVDRNDADQAPIADYIDALDAMWGSVTGTTFGWVQPTGELGAAPLLQLIATSTGDAKTILEQQPKMAKAQQSMMTIMTGGQAQPVTQTFTPAAKTLDGVTFNQFHTAFDPSQAKTPDQQRMATPMMFMYGNDGMDLYSGQVNDTTVVTAGGVADEVLSSAIASAKAGTDLLGKRPEVMDLDSELPKEKSFVGYLALDTLVNTAFTYAGKFGMDMGITIPQSDPIAFALSEDGTAMKFDIFVPTKLVANLVDAGKRVAAGHRAGPPPGAQPGGL